MNFSRITQLQNETFSALANACFLWAPIPAIHCKSSALRNASAGSASGGPAGFSFLSGAQEKGGGMK
jgi:hypothetical protein